MKTKYKLAVTLSLLCFGQMAQANVFDMGPGITNLETVLVGNPGNAADTRYTSPGYGRVDGIYAIGKYEVTNAQYAEFLNAKAKSDPYGLYNNNMVVSRAIERVGEPGDYTYIVGISEANKPVTNVSYWDACRFANWLNNGQADGDTETGAYTLNGQMGDTSDGMQRNAGAKWFVPTEDEWYKAAYYRGGGIDAGYWDYPTQSDSVPSNDLLDPDPGNNANFWQDGFTLGDWVDKTNVGEFENSESPYGTFDQGGNVWEWSAATVGGSLSSCIRGGSLGDYSLHATYRYLPNQAWEDGFTGFRVACVPEPASIIALAGGMGALMLSKRRRA